MCIRDRDNIVFRRGFDRFYINQGVRQDCNMSQILFNICTDDIVRDWKLRVVPGIKINNRKYMNTRNHPKRRTRASEIDDPVITSLLKLNHERFCAEDKLWYLWANTPLRTKIILDNKSRL